jgi:hypothetical protein
MKKVSTRAAAQSRNISRQQLTIGLDLGDRNSWYCVRLRVLLPKNKSFCKGGKGKSDIAGPTSSGNRGGGFLKRPGARLAFP